MDLLSGKRLTILGAALIAAAVAAAVRVGVSGARPTRGAGTATSGAASGMPVRDHLAMALAAEKDGNVAAALAHYRAAVSSDPRCVDRRSAGFLGEAFEEKLKGWIAGLRSGRIAAGPGALADASFIFRRMYGGCG